jgi:hypothetical protein
MPRNLNRVRGSEEEMETAATDNFFSMPVAAADIFVLF